MQGQSTGGFVWYRVRVSTLAGSGTLALLLPAVRTSYEVYADGHLVGAYGGLPSHAVRLVSLPRMFKLPAGSGPTVTLAIRLWTFAGSDDYDGAPRLVRLGFGDSAFVNQEFELENAQTRLGLTTTYIFLLLNLLGGLATLAIYFFRRGEREYLWFGLYLLAGAAAGIGNCYRAVAALSYFKYGVLNDAMFLGSVLAQLLMFQCLLKARRNWLFWCAFSCVVAALPMTMLDLMGIPGT
jgi:sigma-B regulation protein RsbU (phosphoserine phosphatase)